MNILIAPLLAAIIAQIVKLLISMPTKPLRVGSFFKYSGMPSAHSAMMVALVVILFLEEGIHSPLFAISLILTIIVIRDALGIRRYLGQHGKTLNILVGNLKDDKVLEQRYPKLLENIGHTPAQVLIGSLIGITIGIIIYLI
ncbi:MAG: divergent PAP2 family protein [Patescibacteria group bacterium]|nr:divergent PAP2 family protein [Patescibacteria group bacterium]